MCQCNINYSTTSAYNFANKKNCKCKHCFGIGKKQTEKTKIKIGYNNSDKRLYHFINVITGDSFIGLRYNFLRKYCIPDSNLSNLINGKKNIRSVNGWQLNEI